MTVGLIVACLPEAILIKKDVAPNALNGEMSAIYLCLFSLLCRCLHPVLTYDPHGDDFMWMDGELEAIGPNQRQRLLISLDRVGPPGLLQL